MRIRPDGTTRTDSHTVEMGERMNNAVVADGAILHHAIRANADTIAEPYLSLEHGIDVDAHVAAAGERTAHIDASRIGEGDALLEQRLGILLLQRALDIRKLRARVDAHHLALVTRARCRDVDAFGCSHRDHIGQVELLLRIVVAKLRCPAQEMCFRRGHDAGKHLVDPAFVRGRILVLDDAQHASLWIADDAAVACRIIDDLRLDRERSRVGGDAKQFERCRLDEWHIAIEHENAAAVAIE